MVMFVNHLFECNMDVPTAAERTGIKRSVAADWVEHEGPVSDYLAQRLSEMSERVNLTVEDVVAALWAEANRMPQHDEDKTVSHSARVAALGHLAKYKGMFDKTPVSQAAVKVHINIEGNANLEYHEDDARNT